MKKLVVFAVIFSALGAGVFVFVQHTSATKEVAEEFTYEVLSRGNIRNLVSSTGTLEAVGTVEVGSQISGTVDQVYVDYNDRVKKGQLLAVIDKTALETSVRDAEAGLARSEAQLRQAQTEYERNKKLFEDGLIAELNFLEKHTSVETASASVKSAQAALERNQANLKYAEIRSPIAGSVIERAVEAGQTIGSNGNTSLFILAEDLANMQIEALVDESDIGQIKEGQAVRFTVQAYPDDEFTGTVRQVRLNPKVQQDVVNYIVIVDARNDAGTLLPGMTATVDFVVEERFDALLVPNTALYFQPSQTTLAALRGQFQGQPPAGAAPEAAVDGTQPPAAPSAMGTRPTDQTGAADGTGDVKDRLRQRLADARSQMASGANGSAGQPGMTPDSESNNATGKMARVFYLDAGGNLAMARFTPGATDGANTEVLQNTQLTEGLRIVTGVEKTTQSSEKKGLLASLRIPGLGGGGTPGGGAPAGGMGGPPPGGF